ncbi:Mitochondrial carrier protein PET8 [Ophiocordyceps camponoti-floridani]|uniref:Mitochondrial carrier protein PET8 n=1 Tax=Ophiocordyceps camponoti-floridani TaxID=2030778 RepID=A0A8H4Q6M1_9HYPO|nr:Mitochondrial carrier protein PET8 [Ophiocordyceps camponoti-floridani]
MQVFRAFRGVAALTPRRASISTTTCLHLKESTSQTGTDYDHHKQDSLSKQRRGAGHWKPELASDSEEAVKADRGAAGEKDDLRSLQERTKGVAEEKAKAGTSVGDGGL